MCILCQWNRKQTIMHGCLVFSSWPTKLDKHFIRQGRKIALVIDNFPAHPNNQSTLKQWNRFSYIPTLSPDWIIRELSQRNYLLIAAIEAKEDFFPTLLDALYFIRLAWDNIILPQIQLLSFQVTWIRSFFTLLYLEIVKSYFFSKAIRIAEMKQLLSLWSE